MSKVIKKLKMHPSLSKGICKSKVHPFMSKGICNKKVRDIALKATLLIKQARNSLSTVLFLIVRLPRGELLL